MNRIKSILDLVRVQDQVFIVMAVLIGNFLLSFPLSNSLLPMLLFVVSLSSFTFVIDDIADIKIDKLNKKTRNPIVLNQINLPFAKSIASIFFILAISTTILLPSNLFYLSMISLFISLTYSFFIRAKSNPPLDLIYHGVGPTVIFIMIATLYKPADLTILLSAIIIFNMFLLVQLLQEIRDFESDKKLIKTTAIILGKKNSIKLSIVFLSFLVLVVFTGTTFSIFPLKSLIYLPLSYFLFRPLLKGLQNKINEANILDEFRKNLIIVTIIFFVLFLILMFL